MLCLTIASGRIVVLLVAFSFDSVDYNIVESRSAKSGIVDTTIVVVRVGHRLPLILAMEI